MAARGTTIRWLLFLLPLLCHDAAAFVPCTAMLKSGMKAEPKSMMIEGAEVPKGTTPWMVSLQTTEYSTRMHVCGGVIVSLEWILTTATCAQGVDFDYLWVVAGDHNLTDCDGDESYRKVDRKIIHRQYDSFTRYYNIALLHLKHRLWRSPNIEPIVVLRDPVSYTQETCKVFGWGFISLDWTTPDVLMGVNQTMFSQKECTDIFPNMITDDMFCAADLYTGAGPCQGDWGGPLVCRDMELSGIASWAAGCGSPTLPAVYTNTTYLYDWIDDIVHFHDH